MNKIFNLSRFKKKLIIIISDIIICLSSFIFSFIIIGKSFKVVLSYDLIIFLLSSLSFLPFFIIFQFYTEIFRFLNFYYFFKVITALIFCTLFNTLLFFILKIDQFDFSVILLHSLIFMILILYFRMFIILLSNFLSEKFINKSNIIIYGAGLTGLSALNTLKEYKIIAFLDDDPNKWNTKISNIKVYPPDSLEQLILKFKPSEIFVSIPSLSFDDRRRIINGIKDHSILLKFLPNVKDFAAGKIEINDFKSIQPEDLISRSIKWNLKKINKKFINKNICITGAGGSIGSEICKQIINLNPSQLIIVDHSEINLFNIYNQIIILKQNSNLNCQIIKILGSILDINIIDHIFYYSPNIIFHAAAYKHVNMIEDNPFVGLKNNAVGTFNLVDAAIKYHCDNFIFISTDKAVNPSSVMGATKRIAEQYIQSISNNKTTFSIVRFGNVLGSSGSVFELFSKQIQSGGPITITDKNVTRYFMSIHESVGLVLEASTLSGSNQTYVLKMGNPIKIVDLAKKMIKLSGLKIRDAKNSGDIEFKYIGLRPGEKMFEELVIDSDYLGTTHPEILILNSKKFEDNYSSLLKDKTNNILKENNLNSLKKYLTNHVEGSNINFNKYNY